MTRFIHDQFAKDYLEELLKAFGEVQAPKRVPAEVREIDVWFNPSPTTSEDVTVLGLLGEVAQTTAIIEPYRNPATVDELRDCLLKLLVVIGEVQREAKRNKRQLSDHELPQLWVLTPTASSNLLSKFNPIEGEISGIYRLGEALRTTVVVIHQLPRTPETLWLRLLGRGRVKSQAIDDLEALPVNHPYRENTLELLVSLQRNLSITEDVDEEDREFIMRLAPIFNQEKEEAKQEGLQEGRQEGRQEGLQEGLQEGRRQMLENLLLARFGELDEELEGVIPLLCTVTPQTLATLALSLPNLSREEFLQQVQDLTQ
ncbi:hypothetical protein PN462_14970 [Spirulina sp. CS-785/01]|uniref:hypothetical protein n=1 Tax=Spirulina sp. CS-785/01 TaxID=3021716 RepID=UPI00233038CE|nr:hypothetical protein [Spirulina sp. CS-785/01]MDB9314412.1 hypothetical protein [Spirulina sp. CS-785/01]